MHLVLVGLEISLKDAVVGLNKKNEILYIYNIITRLVTCKGLWINPKKFQSAQSIVNDKYA